MARRANYPQVVVRRADLIKTMAQRKRGRNSRRNYKRRRRVDQRRALEAAMGSTVIVDAPRPRPSDEIIDYFPSVVVPKPKEEIVPVLLGIDQVPTPAVPAPDALSECDKRLLDILSDPTKFTDFKNKVQGATANKLIVVG